MPNPVQVQLRLAGGGEPETLWVEPHADAHRLTRSALTAPLARGDVVRVEEDSTGTLQVVDVVEPADTVLTVFAADPAYADALAALWHATGADETLTAGPVLVTTWPGVPMDAVAQQLNGDEDAGKGQWLLAAEPHERRREAQGDVDFELA